MVEAARARVQMAGAPGREASLAGVNAWAYKIPDRQTEADGTYALESTLVVVEVGKGGQTGLGYTYTSETVVPLIAGVLAKAVKGYDASTSQSLGER